MKGMKRMALLSTMVKAVAEIEGLDETQVGWIARYLREAGLISQAGRGRGAARMSAKDAANLLIAVNGSASAKDAVKTVSKFSTARLMFDRMTPPSKHSKQNEYFFSRIRGSNQRGVLLTDFLASLIRSFQIGHIGNLNDDDSISIIVKFTRPRTECNIQIYEADEDGALTLISDATFCIYDESDRILTEEEIKNKYGDEYEFVPDKSDETTITRRTLSAVGKILTG
jgi:hypothetical protein